MRKKNKTTFATLATLATFARACPVLPLFSRLAPGTTLAVLPVFAVLQLGEGGLKGVAMPVGEEKKTKSKLKRKKQIQKERARTCPSTQTQNLGRRLMAGRLLMRW